MPSLTIKERETLLILFKDYTSFYNANSISKVLKISHVGAQKIFQRLKKENLIIDTRIGKSITYKLNLKDNYTLNWRKVEEKELLDLLVKRHDFGEERVKSKIKALKEIQGKGVQQGLGGFL